MAPAQENFEAFLNLGTEAYSNQRFDEAAAHFEKAIAIDAGSVQAHLALAVARLTLYKRRPSPVATYLSTESDISVRGLAFYREREKDILVEQNSTNWPAAEKSLKRANQLAPQNELVVEYLCALYFARKDPVDDTNDCMDEAKHWLERLLELNPEHRYANHYCGMVLCGKARKLLPNYGRFPPVPEPDLPSLRIKVGPLLEEASRHLARASALQGESTSASFFVDEVTSMKAYLDDPDIAARASREKFRESFRQHSNATAKQTHAQGASVPSNDSVTVTFRLTPEALAEDRQRPFPPNPWRM